MTGTALLVRTPAAAHPEPRQRTSRRAMFGVIVFGLYLVVIGCWSLATPPFGAPDEPSHVYRALSVTAGQVGAPSTGRNAPDDPSMVVFVPGALAADAHGLGCFAHHPQRPASCLHLDGPPTDQTAVYSAAARYLPVYYAAVGWPANLVHGLNTLWAMRAVSVVLCALLLTLATVAAARLGPRVPLGLLVALTPSVYFLAGAVNPDSVEICAAAAAWTVGLLALRGAGPVAQRALRWWALPAAVMVLARADGVVWLAIVVAGLAVAAYRRGVHLDPRRSALRQTLMVTVAAAAVSLGWTVYSGQLKVGPPPGWTPRADSLGVRLGRALGQLPLWWQQAVAGFGWRDTYLPGAVGLVLLAALLGLGWLARPDRRVAVAAAGLVVAALVISLGAQAHGYDLLGNWWQGRYVLPALIGVPVLVSLEPRFSRPRDRVGAKWTSVGVASAVLGLHVAGLLVWLHRCMNGLGHDFVWNAPWAPPLDARLLVALDVVGMLGLGAVALLVATGSFGPRRIGRHHAAA